MSAGALARRVRNAEQPVRVLWRAGLATVGCATILLALVGLLVGGPEAALPALVGGLVVLASILVSLGVAMLLPRGNGENLALALLAAYPVKVLVGAAALFLLPFPASWSRPWFAASAVTSVIVMIVTEWWVVRNLRIPYFVPVEASQTPPGTPSNEE